MANNATFSWENQDQPNEIQLHPAEHQQSSMQNQLNILSGYPAAHPQTPLQNPPDDLSGYDQTNQHVGTPVLENENQENPESDYHQELQSLLQNPQTSVLNLQSLLQNPQTSDLNLETTEMENQNQHEHVIPAEHQPMQNLPNQSGYPAQYQQPTAQNPLNNLTGPDQADHFLGNLGIENQNRADLQPPPVQNVVDEMYPAAYRCPACKQARRKCNSECKFRNLIPENRSLEYAQAVETYTKKNLLNWLKEIPADKGRLFFEYRFEEAINFKADRLGGNARIIRNQAARIRQLEELLRERDATLRNYTYGGSHPSVSVGPAAATLFQAESSLPISTVPQTLQYPQQVPNPHLTASSQQQILPQHQVPSSYPTHHVSPFQHQQPHSLSNATLHQMSHQPQQLQQQFSQEQITTPNQQYLNPTQHQFPQ